jgi:hypothetical protein
MHWTIHPVYRAWNRITLRNNNHANHQCILNHNNRFRNVFSFTLLWLYSLVKMLEFPLHRRTENTQSLQRRRKQSWVHIAIAVFCIILCALVMGSWYSDVIHNINLTCNAWSMGLNLHFVAVYRTLSLRKPLTWIKQEICNSVWRPREKALAMNVSHETGTAKMVIRLRCRYILLDFPTWH